MANALPDLKLLRIFVSVVRHQGFANAQQELNLSTFARKLASDAFSRGIHKKLSVDAEIQRFLQTFPRGSSEVERIYESLLRLAAVDGTVRRGERAFLEQVSAGLGYDINTLDTRLKKVMPA